MAGASGYFTAVLLRAASGPKLVLRELLQSEWGLRHGDTGFVRDVFSAYRGCVAPGGEGESMQDSLAVLDQVCARPLVRSHVRRASEDSCMA